VREMRSRVICINERDVMDDSRESDEEVDVSNQTT